MLPFVGPSYNLANRRASVQRAVNLYLVGLETPSKAPWIMQSVPGLTLLSALGAEIRGVFEAKSRAFVVAGSTLYELDGSGNSTSRGTLATSTGPVDFAWGTTQLVIVDGPNGYVFRLATNVLAQITDSAWLGSNRVSYLGGFFIFVDPDTQVHYVSAIDDASSLDALDFASNEESPDNTVAHLVDHSQAIFLGQQTTEFWSLQGATDYPLSKDTGTSLEVGCVACFSAQKIDNGVMFIGRDKNGSGIVYRLIGNQPQRVSTQAVEEALQASTDLSAARAYVYQKNGRTFYCVNAPGMASTWCFEVSSGSWFEKCDLDDSGQFAAFRVTCHAFALGKHMAGDADGNVYLLDDTVNTFAGDPLRRTRISPNDARPGRDRQFFSEFVLDTNVGEAAQGQTVTVELSWSDDGGYTWGNPVARTFVVGQYAEPLRWQRLGMARDRVWRVDCADDAPYSIVGGDSR
jgi:hypothetical protein